MKKLLITMAMMSAMAMAQTSSGTGTDQSSSSGTGSSSATQSGSTSTSGETQSGTQAKPESDKAAAKTRTLTGCLHKEGDNYWLKTRTARYHVMSSQDLSAHVDHEIKVAGNVSRGPMPGSEDKKQVRHLEASNIDMVSDKCKMGTRGDKKEKAEQKSESQSEQPK